jgi:hypothetical protein
MGNSPLEEIMVSIYDESGNILNTASWLGIPPYGTIENTRKHLISSEKRLKECYERLKALTGLDPCK